MSYRFLAICLLFATTLPLDAHAQEGDPPPAPPFSKNAAFAMSPKPTRTKSDLH